MLNYQLFCKNIEKITIKNFFVKFFSIFVKQFINSLKTKLLC